jgi:hypothetical protein
MTTIVVVSGMETASKNVYGENETVKTNNPLTVFFGAFLAMTVSLPAPNI